MRRGLRVRHTQAPLNAATLGAKRRQQRVREQRTKPQCERVATLPPDVVYSGNLEATKRYFTLDDANYAVADAGPDGQLKRGYCLLQKLFFCSEDRSDVLYTCTCSQASAQRDRLSATNTFVEDLQGFIRREQSQYCIHAQACKKLMFPTFEPDVVAEDDDIKVHQLSVDPLLVAVHDGQSFGLLQPSPHASKYKVHCSTCSSRHHCQHLESYVEWCKENDVNIEHEHVPEVPVEFCSISTKRIPYPLPTTMKQQHDDHECGKWQFPTELVPEQSEGLCSHGNRWKSGDPVTEGWVISHNVVIHKASVTIQDPNRKIFYRPAEGTCGCKQHFDGQEFLLFNLDNHHLFFYGFLFGYMHNMLEAKYPLASCQRACSRYHQVSSTTPPTPLHLLRRAWNGFARLLDIRMEQSFECPLCGVHPEVIICDGTMIGYRKDLLPSLTTREPSNSQPIRGSKHKDRVYVRTPKTRSLLLKYSGVTKDRKMRASPTPLSAPEFHQLVAGLRKDEAHGLAELLKEFHPQRGPYMSPKPYRQFLSELARNSPVCGLLQIGGDGELSSSLQEVIDNQLDLKDASNHKHLTKMQQHAPVIASFLVGLPRPHPRVYTILKELLTVIDATFTNQEPTLSEHRPQSRNSSPLCYFPCLPEIYDLRKYEADDRLQAKETDSCRKLSYGHPTLSPGIFTIYCQHGVCYGFEVMAQCESPKIPFEIFTTRFQRPPHAIVYDNACRLHTYCLNREPQHFKDTLFLVDRFHWRGHIGCSSGYNLSVYGGHLKNVNSQVNEQANSDLQKIRGQLAYMTAANFHFHLSLFLAVKNCDIIKSIDVSRIQL